MSNIINIARRYKKEILFFIFFFLVSSTSFAVGYLAQSEFLRSPITIEKCQDNLGTR
ncbi:MAG: hypothetical protein AAB495_02790 [Patescibacteria group bacterium]